ncbi:Hypothetical protein EIN_110300, partial [Entamoeba invadens IP1]
SFLEYVTFYLTNRIHKIG